jgi:hypothetical protein
MKKLMEGSSIDDRNKMILYLIKRRKEGFESKFLAEMGAVFALDKGELMLEHAQKVKQGFQEGKLNEDEVFDLRNNSVGSCERKHRAKIVNTYDQTGIEKIYKQTVQDTKDDLFSQDEQQEIWEDKVKNPRLYSNEARNYFAQNIGVTHKDIQLDLNRQYTSYAVQNNDKELLKSIAHGVAGYAKENYEAAYKVVIEAAKVLDVPKSVVERIIKDAGISETALVTETQAAKSADCPPDNRFKQANQTVINPFAAKTNQIVETAQTQKTDEPEKASGSDQTEEKIAEALAKGSFADLDKYLSNAPKHVKEQIYAMLERSPVLFKLYVDAHKDGIFKNQDISPKLKDEAAVWLISRTGSMAAAKYISENTFSKYYADKAAQILDLPSAA